MVQYYLSFKRTVPLDTTFDELRHGFIFIFDIVPSEHFGTAKQNQFTEEERVNIEVRMNDSVLATAPWADIESNPELLESQSYQRARDHIESNGLSAPGRVEGPVELREERPYSSDAINMDEAFIVDDSSGGSIGFRPPS